MIYLGAGHGGQVNGVKDRGAAGNGVNEWDVCTKVLNEFSQLYKDDVRVIPQSLTLANRIFWINKHLAADDTYIELHMNSASPDATGVEVFYFGGDNLKARVAGGMSNRFATKLSLPNRGAKPDTQTRFKRLGVIRDVRCKSYLIEMGFISNKLDLFQVQTKGKFGLEALLEFKSSDPADRKVAVWAKTAWEKALRKGVKNPIVSANTNPQELVKSDTLEWMIYNAGGYEKVTGQGREVQHIVTALDRLGVLDRLPDFK